MSTTLSVADIFYRIGNTGPCSVVCLGEVLMRLVIRIINSITLRVSINPSICCMVFNELFQCYKRISLCSGSHPKA